MKTIDKIKPGTLVTGYYGEGVTSKVVRVVGPLENAPNYVEVVEYRPAMHIRKGIDDPNLFYGVRCGDVRVTVAGPETIAKYWTPPTFNEKSIVKMYVNGAARVCKNSVYVERKIDAPLRHKLLGLTPLGPVVYVIPGIRSKHLWYYEPLDEFTRMAISTLVWRNVRADHS